MNKTGYYLVTASQGEECAITIVDWICSQPSALWEKTMPSEWPPPPHEVHGEAATMDLQLCLVEDVNAIAMWAGPWHRRGSVAVRDARICVGSAFRAARGRTTMKAVAELKQKFRWSASQTQLSNDIIRTYINL